VHSGPHYLAPPEEPAQPLAAPDSDEAIIEQAVEEFIDQTRDDLGEITDPALMEREDDEDFAANLADSIAPLTELVGEPCGNKLPCPFHEDVEPSCAIYPDHYHCYGCGAHGSRIDWLMQVEGMTKTEAIAYIKDWPGPQTHVVQNGNDDAEKLVFVKSIWLSAGLLLDSMAERYLDETRGIDVTKLPQDIHRNLRFHPSCVFGPGTHLPCLIALMRDPLTDAPVGIQRIALEHQEGRIVKIERRMLGRAGVVKLWPAGSTLVVGEGLETVLAAATRIPYAGVPLTPAWAALSSTKLKILPVIPGVQRLIVLVDNDANGEGQSAAAHVAAVWRAAGRSVELLMPPTVDTDFNDLVLKEDTHVSI
jgi:hypothetical protein